MICFLFIYQEIDYFLYRIKKKIIKYLELSSNTVLPGALKEDTKYTTVVQ